MGKKGSIKYKKSVRQHWKPSFFGLVFALLFTFFSVLPSLLARPVLIQGVVTGLSAITGYGIGLGLSSLIRWLTQKELSKETKQKGWQIMSVVGPIVLLVCLVGGINWQNDVRSQLGMEPIGVTYIIGCTIVSVVVFWVFLKIGRSVKRFFNFLVKKLSKKTPLRVTVVCALIFSGITVYFISTGVIARGFFTVADTLYSQRDYTAPEGIVQPMESTRSGSPESLIAWDTIGYQGKGFVGGGATRGQLAEYNKSEAKEPIRIYAGLKSAGTAEERADLAVQELKRTNAFEREYLIVATATGTGWLDPSIVDTVEFIHNGDTAIVSQQYSYLPSWISFLVDQNRAKEAGVALYDAVIEEYLKLPENDRPKLIAYGLSLGSFGGQTAYSSGNDLRRSVDGAMFTGTPSSTDLWQEIENNRDQGSPMWQPTINGGRSIRFGSNKEDILDNPEIWNDNTKILYLQHANDPVVWFNFDLIFNKPDWLNEPRGDNVSVATRWFPIVTFFQIGLDQAISASAPFENAHWYINTPSYAWGAIIPPEDWNIEKADALQSFINNDFESARLKN